MEMKTIIQQIHDYICDSLLENPDVQLDPQASLIGDGYLDSFKLSQLWLHLEEIYEIEIDIEDLIELTNLEQDSVTGIAAIVMQKIK